MASTFPEFVGVSLRERQISRISFRPTTDILCALQSPRTRPSTTAPRRLTVTGAYPLSHVQYFQRHDFAPRVDNDPAREGEFGAEKLEWNLGVTRWTTWSLYIRLQQWLSTLLLNPFTAIEPPLRLYSRPALTLVLSYSIKKPKTNRYPSLNGVDPKFRRNHRHALHGTAKALVR